jgi:uncharacterized UPF0160 family protein
MKLITHNDRFHADDVFTMATLRILFGSQITEVIRTRDETIIQIGDIVFDVGNIYDPSKNRFDHHQKEGAGTRTNNIPYASFGLVWQKWGSEICGSQLAADFVDKKLVQAIDASDNGFALYSYTIPDTKEYVMDTICGAFGATWKEEDNYDEAFFEVVDIAEKILKREIKCAQDKCEAIPFVEQAYRQAEDKRIVVLDEYYPWGETLSHYPEILFVVSPNKEKNQWRINAIQQGRFMNKKDLPAAWAGLREVEFEKVSGVVGALFCHRKLFLAVARTKESALELAKKAIEA